jgi:LacI family transcriptional regulator
MSKHQKKNVATLHDVARAASVSPGTVSRALSRPELVAEATRNKILGIVDRLHYLPHPHARNLKLSRPTVIGAVIPRSGISTFSQTIASLNDALEMHGLTLIVSQPEVSSQASKHAAYRLLERGADALILLGEDHAPELYRLLEYRGLTHLLLSPIRPPKGSPHVSINHRRAGHIAAIHLIELGHKKFAYVGSATPNNPRAQERLVGVQAELKAHGLALPEGSITNQPHQIDSGRIAVKQILANHKDTTAIICTSDYYTLGVIRALHELRINVPRDISVVSFNNNDFSSFTMPAITTVDLKYQEVGKEAARMVLRLIRKEKVSPVMIEPELCIRETSGPSRF